MAESKQQAIERLLREGLNHYGMGQAAEAIDCWRQVLELEPDHPQALEYLETAADEAVGPEPGGAGALDANAELLKEAMQRLREQDPETALELLETIAQRDPDHLEVQGYIEMVRSQLLKRYRERIGSGSAVPHLRLAPDQVMKFNLPSDAGFLLSFIDGATRVDELLSVCAMDEFRTLRILAQMVDAGIVEFSP